MYVGDMVGQTFSFSLEKVSPRPIKYLGFSSPTTLATRKRGLVFFTLSGESQIKIARHAFFPPGFFVTKLSEINIWSSGGDL
jgi:hypothetical protein